MNLLLFLRLVLDFFVRRFFLISWISLVTYIFYDSFMYYKKGRQFYHLRNILSLGLCVSRGTAAVLNLCCALVLLPLCKKTNQLLYRALSKLWPGLFFFWLERAKSFHITVAITLLVFAVIHSISHLCNMWNFSRRYDEMHLDINLASYKNENPFHLLLSQAGLSGISMLLIMLTMGVMSSRTMRRRLYNAFWFTHQLYMPFLLLLIIHPLSGALKEEVLDESRNEFNSSQRKWSENITTSTAPLFVPIKSKTWLWMSLPLSCFFVDLLWRVVCRNRADVRVVKATRTAGRTISLTLACPDDAFSCGIGQYVLLQCPQASLLEWHPFTVVRVPSSSQRDFEVLIRVKGDWTEALESLLLEKRHDGYGVRLLVDGPFSSPMQSARRCAVAICVAAGVGITPFVPILHDMYSNPRGKNPGRLHLIFIVRHEKELTWIAELSNKCIIQLRNANRPDRLHLEFYVTNNKVETVVTERGTTIQDEEKAMLLTPNVTRKNEVMENGYNIAKEFPILGCRVKRGRPHWDRVFGYWMQLYTGEHLNLYCCGPKKLVKLLKNKCGNISMGTKTKFKFIHEGFS